MHVQWLTSTQKSGDPLAACKSGSSDSHSWMDVHLMAGKEITQSTGPTNLRPMLKPTTNAIMCYW
ncbi:hypothetical protein TSMEX_008238 [Taenia solium]|eukprot:TsM_000237400 transcript=TsM_000237400 gene=TsM_000237400